MKKYLFVFLMVSLSFATSRGATINTPVFSSIAKHSPGNEKADATCADDLLNFAQTLIGVQYHFASSNPDRGFDCSGFVGYVFHNFNIDVPRSSADYANAGERIKLAEAKPGDVILFTGTQKRSRRIGHVGIIVSNADNQITFIHSTSGKEHGVTITVMDKTYRHRFVRIVRVLKQNNDA